MSLKAKMEAVIYASEEPVTLAQLAGLLGLEAQAELDKLGAAAELGLQPGETAADADVGASAEMVPAGAEQVQGAGEGAAEVPIGDERVAEEPVTEEPVAEGLDTEGLVAEGLEDKRAGRERERKLREYLRQILDELLADYATSARGLEVREVAGGFRMGTKPEYHDAVRGFVKSLKPALKLSLQALETLAVVAYKQPVTAPEVSEIRGVDSGGVLGGLMARKLVTTAGRKQVIGRPILYKTTKDFLLRFGLKDVSELPSIEEFEKMAGELVEQEEIPMGEGEQRQGGAPEEAADEHAAHESVEAEKGVSAPQADGSGEDLNAVSSSGSGVEDLDHSEPEGTEEA